MSIRDTYDYVLAHRLTVALVAIQFGAVFFNCLGLPRAIRHGYPMVAISLFAIALNLMMMIWQIGRRNKQFFPRYWIEYPFSADDWNDGHRRCEQIADEHGIAHMTRVMDTIKRIPENETDLRDGGLRVGFVTRKDYIKMRLYT